MRSTGVAETLKAQLGDLVSDCKCIQFAKPDELRECDFLVLGGFVGLVIDEVNESHLTEERITDWVAALRSHVPAPSVTAAR
jgi:hypothetical protein